MILSIGDQENTKTHYTAFEAHTLGRFIICAWLCTESWPSAGASYSQVAGSAKRPHNGGIPFVGGITSVVDTQTPAHDSRKSTTKPLGTRGVFGMQMTSPGACQDIFLRGFAGRSPGIGQLYSPLPSDPPDLFLTPTKHTKK